MPKLLTCEECELSLLGFEARGPDPINHEECPNCGCTEFYFASKDPDA